ncbi:hypothetical protein O9992_20310 [Vibrio lentus]|nr:hypothetical protein [Vibrio lentus]
MILIIWCDADGDEVTSNAESILDDNEGFICCEDSGKSQKITTRLSL